jgi:long-chain acyl-CoA synthetase
MPLILKSTITATFLERIKQTPNKIGFQFKKDIWTEVSFLEFYQKTEALSLGLIHRGVKKGDRVAILATTRMEWSIADFAILGAQAITVPLYSTSTAKEIQHLLEHSEAKILFLENQAQFKKLQDQVPALKSLKAVLYLDDLHSIMEEGESLRRKDPYLFEKNLLAAQPEDPITICYTSGTTGIPKGAVLTHLNMMSVLKDCVSVFKNHIHADHETLLTFLPFSHIIGKVESMATFVFGWKESYATSIQDLEQDFREVKPTLIFSVPRIFEKAHTQIQLRLGAMPWVKRKVFDLAVKSGKQKSILGTLRHQLYKQLILSRVVDGFGGKLKFAICGGAPLSRELAEFFEVTGIMIFEGYGLTETCAPVCLNHFEAYKPGSVGRPLPEVAIKIGDDGEILIRSDKLFTQYWKMPEETKAAFEDDWFKTGDIGFLDPEGFLHITDRKKDLIITSGGKNIAPQKIENLLKNASPLIEEVVVIGDRRKYLTALLTLSPEALSQFAEEKEILFSDLESLTQHAKVRQWVQSLIEQTNAELSSVETIKKFMILPQNFSIQTGELTASLKVKRGEISKRFRDLIESMYRES